jgi:1-deoxy-D-xylulose-5-phosphate reductoisomerase
MSQRPLQVAVFGSTGSIGRSALEVIEASDGRLRAIALSAHGNVELLRQQAERDRPRWVVVTEQDAAARFGTLPAGCELLVGEEGLRRVASEASVDVVVTAIVGIAGLSGTCAALEAGKRVALANKETLVAAGEIVSRLAAERGGQIVPIDSEHSAVFQALQAGRRGEVKRIILTASGGPFRNLSINELRHVTIEQALDHPTWNMGKKITVDSATMMNKALEIIEARWLFDLAPEQIEVVIHPQSTVHSLVEFVDGSIVAQMGPTDMRLPIQYALSYPERWPCPAEGFDFSAAFSLDFEPADRERFAALDLGYEVAGAGGTAGAVVNAANEAAVGAFLSGKLQFNEIVPACRRVLDAHPFEPAPSLSRLFELDRWAREEVLRCCCH